MPLVIDNEVPDEAFRGGATYKTLVGGEASLAGRSGASPDALLPGRSGASPDAASPVTIGIQTCPPGYKTALHSHPYQEVIMVIEGEGEAWTAETGEVVALRPGVTLVLPAGVKHWFHASGSRPLRIYGVHASPRRIVLVHQDA